MPRLSKSPITQGLKSGSPSHIEKAGNQRGSELIDAVSVRKPKLQRTYVGGNLQPSHLAEMEIEFDLRFRGKRLLVLAISIAQTRFGRCRYCGEFPTRAWIRPFDDRTFGVDPIVGARTSDTNPIRLRYCPSHPGSA